MDGIDWSDRSVWSAIAIAAILIVAGVWAWRCYFGEALEKMRIVDEEGYPKPPWD